MRRRRTVSSLEQVLGGEYETPGGTPVDDHSREGPAADDYDGHRTMSAL
jgi:hypothetical protein